MHRRYLGLAALALAGAAQAADNGVYAGIGFTRSGESGGGSTLTLGDSNGYKAFLGFRPLDRLAVEVAYADLGDSASGAIDTGASATSAFLVGFIPVALVDFYAKAGMARWKTSLDTGLIAASDSGTDLTWGAGIGLHFTSFGARLEYERIETGGSEPLDMLSLGVSYTFL